MKKTISSILILSLICSCAVTSSQIDSRKDIVSAIKLCVAIFQDEMDWTKSANTATAELPNKQQFSGENYNKFFAVKQRYPKEWEEFKTKIKNNNNSVNSISADDLWSGTLAIVGTFGVWSIVQIFDRVLPAKKDTSYSELLPTCEDKMSEAKSQGREEIYKAEERKRLAVQTEIKKLLKSKKITKIIYGITNAIRKVYTSSNRNEINAALIISKSSDHDLSVVSIRDNYTIYSNKVFTIAIRKSPEKSDLKNSSLVGTYYKFIGTKIFNDENSEQNELAVFEEVRELERYGPLLVRSAAPEL